MFIVDIGNVVLVVKFDYKFLFEVVVEWCVWVVMVCLVISFDFVILL